MMTSINVVIKSEIIWGRAEIKKKKKRREKSKRRIAPYNEIVSSPSEELWIKSLQKITQRRFLTVKTKHYLLSLIT